MKEIVLLIASLFHLNTAEIKLPPPVQEIRICQVCSISEPALNLIRHFEGFSPFTYKDAVGKDTIGYGHLIKAGEKFEEPLIGDAAEKLLRSDVRWAERAVNKSVDVSLFQNQFDPLVSFTFNLGSGAFATSTLLKKVNAKKHHEVPPQFLRWNKAGGKVPLRGLTLRREAEATMYKENLID